MCGKDGTEERYGKEGDRERGSAKKNVAKLAHPGSKSDQRLGGPRHDERIMRASYLQHAPSLRRRHPYARVQPGVQNVHRNVDADDTSRRKEDNRLRRGIVSQ